MWRLPGALCLCFLAATAPAWGMGGRPSESSPLRYEDAPGKRGAVVREPNAEATAEWLVGPLPEEISESGKYSYCANPTEADKSTKRPWPSTPPSDKCEVIKEVDGATKTP